MSLSDELVLLIRDFVPVHPTAKLIQEAPKLAFGAFRLRYVSPCRCCNWHGNVAVNRMAWGCDLELPACDDEEKCVNKLFGVAYKGIYPPNKESLQVVVRRLKGEWWELDPADYDSD